MRPSKPKSKIPSRRLKILLIGVALLAILWLSHTLWLPAIGNFLVVNDALQTADAIVPLAGGDARCVYAAQLFQQEYAKWYIAANMPLHAPGIRRTYGELVKQEAIWQGVPEEAILITPGEVTTTYEEALAIRELAEKQGWKTLIVVTDPFHTRRARWAFRDVLRDTDISITMIPVEDAEYHPESWWRDQDSLRETWTEYLKLILYAIGYR